MFNWIKQLFGKSPSNERSLEVVFEETAPFATTNTSNMAVSDVNHAEASTNVVPDIEQITAQRTAGDAQWQDDSNFDTELPIRMAVANLPPDLMEKLVAFAQPLLERNRSMSTLTFRSLVEAFLSNTAPADAWSSDARIFSVIRSNLSNERYCEILLSTVQKAIQRG